MRSGFVSLLISLNCYGQVVVVDDYGNPVQIPSPASRIVSLAPHLTELLYAAGAGAKVVAVVDYSDYPSDARTLPRVGSDAHINLEAVLALRADLVVAWPNATTRRAVDRLAELGLPVFRSEPRELDDVATTLARLGTLAGSESEAAAAAAQYRQQIRKLEQGFSGRATVRVFYKVWDRPLQTVNGNHVISKVIGLCGGENVFAELPVIAPEVNAEGVLRAKPDVILTSGSPSPVPGLDRIPVRHIPADLIQRHTPRLAQGAERVCRVLEEIRRGRGARS
jgi:iron complex transport system substrate-binding protein